jgi:hypothetical protein
LLGVFYGSRYNSNLVDDKIGNERSDLNRSRFYFDRSIDLNPNNYAAYSYAGHFTQYHDDQSIAKVSRNYFQRAATIGTRYQKPWISMAMIDLEAFKNPAQALAALEQALLREEYDSERKDPKPELISYLQACALCLDAREQTGASRSNSLNSALEKLDSSLSQGTPQIFDLFRTEKDTYFKVLHEDPITTEKYGQLLNRPQLFDL